MLKKYSYLSALINLVFFIAFFSLFFPIYNSKEDAYALYLLSGGFGNAPSEMLGYNYLLHPFLTLFIKKLFLLTNSVNWYSITLIFAHYLSCTIILALILRKKKALIPLLSWIILFLVFEGFFLIIPDFSGASITLTCAGLFYLLTKTKEGELRFKQYFLVTLLLLLASFYRIHTMVPLIGVFLCFIIVLPSWKIKLKSISVVLLAGIFILLFNYFHGLYYESIAPGWTKEQINKEKIFSLYNYYSPELYNLKPGEKWYTEAQLTSRALFLDSSFLSGSWLDSMHHDLVHAPPVKWKLEPGWMKWFFINNRLFFCVMLLFVLLYGLQKNTIFPTLLSLAAITGGIIYLVYTAKLPPYILVSALYFVCLACLLGAGKTAWADRSVFMKNAILAILSFFIFWGIVRLYKTSRQNKDLNAFFKLAHVELAANKDKLFIITKNFPIHNFYVFDLPKNFLLENYTDTEHFIINIAQPVFKKFHIQNTRDIPYLSNIFFWGEPFEPVKQYFEKITGKPMQIVAPIPGYKQAIVWRVIPAGENAGAPNP